MYAEGVQSMNEVNRYFKPFQILNGIRSNSRNTPFQHLIGSLESLLRKLSSKTHFVRFLAQVSFYIFKGHRDLIGLNQMYQLNIACQLFLCTDFFPAGQQGKCNKPKFFK